jgi:hypothetical protein
LAGAFSGAAATGSLMTAFAGAEVAGDAGATTPGSGGKTGGTLVSGAGAAELVRIIKPASSVNDAKDQRFNFIMLLVEI